MGSARPRITSKDLSPVVQIVTWVLLAFILLAIILRLLTRYYLLHRIKSDDLFIVIAFVSQCASASDCIFCPNFPIFDDTDGVQVFSLGQSITLLVPAGSAWGVLQGDLSRQSQIARLKVSSSKHTFAHCFRDWFGAHLLLIYRRSTQANCFCSQESAAPKPPSSWDCLP